ALGVEVCMRITARIAFCVRAGWSHLSFTTWRLPLSFTTHVAGAAAASIAGSVALTGTVSLRVTRRAFALTLPLTGSFALSDAASLATAAKLGGFTACHDLTGVA